MKSISIIAQVRLREQCSQFRELPAADGNWRSLDISPTTAKTFPLHPKRDRHNQRWENSPTTIATDMGVTHV
jgi:hypothetical protein